MYIVTMLCFTYHLFVLYSFAEQYLKRNFTLKISYREGVSLVCKAFAFDSGGYEFIS